MNNFWIKLYHEILHDPKMGKLPDNVWRRCIELFLMAGELDKNGELPPIDDIAWALRVDADQLRKEIAQLVEAGILTEDEAGLHVTNFCTRQGRISDADKQRAYRERKRTAAVSGSGNGNETGKNGQSLDDDPPVTDQKPECYQSVTDGNADVDKDRDRDRDTPTTSAPAREEPEPIPETTAALTALTVNYTDFISTTINQFLADDFREMAGDIQPDWVAKAYQVAGRKDKMSWPYVRGVLRKCIEAGRWVDKPKGAKNGQGRIKQGKRGTTPKAGTFGYRPIEENRDASAIGSGNGGKDIHPEPEGRQASAAAGNGADRRTRSVRARAYQPI